MKWTMIFVSVGLSSLLICLWSIWMLYVLLKDFNYSNPSVTTSKSTSIKRGAITKALPNQQKPRIRIAMSREDWKKVNDLNNIKLNE